jgi:hypothetical protein
VYSKKEKSDQVLRLAMNLQAALPQGIVPFVFAKEYNVHPNVLSTAYDPLTHLVLLVLLTTVVPVLAMEKISKPLVLLPGSFLIFIIR